MLIDNNLLDGLSAQARASERLRVNFDLRTSADDSSQRMLNALEPGTKVPVHRHCKSTETVAVIRGSVRQNFYDNDGKLIESAVISANSSCPFFVVPIAAWHNSEALESGTIIFEAKDGAYEPLAPEDIYGDLAY